MNPMVAPEIVAQLVGRAVKSLKNRRFGTDRQIAEKGPA
jgi:hypothetical protein